MPQWLPGEATCAEDGAGGFSLVLPLLRDGVHVSDVSGVMSGDGDLTITITTLPGATPIRGFRAWQRGV